MTETRAMCREITVNNTETNWDLEIDKRPKFDPIILKQFETIGNSSLEGEMKNSVQENKDTKS